MTQRPIFGWDTIWSLEWQSARKIFEETPGRQERLTQCQEDLWEQQDFYVDTEMHISCGPKNTGIGFW